MPDALRCSHCSSPLTDASAATCAYCGVALAGAPGPTTDASRFAAVERSPRYPELMRRQPSATGAIVMYLFMLAFSVVWTSMAATFALVGAGIASVGAVVPAKLAAVPVGVGAFVALLPGLMAVLGVLGFALALRKLLRFLRSPTTRTIGIIRDKRTQVSTGAGSDRSVSTSYYLLLEARGGERTEHRVSAGLSGRVVAGDIGVAYLRDGDLLDFQVVTV